MLPVGSRNPLFIFTAVFAVFSKNETLRHSAHLEHRRVSNKMKSTVACVRMYKRSKQLLSFRDGAFRNIPNPVHNHNGVFLLYLYVFFRGSAFSLYSAFQPQVADAVQPVSMSAAGMQGPLPTDKVRGMYTCTKFSLKSIRRLVPRRGGHHRMASQ